MAYLNGNHIALGGLHGFIQGEIDTQLNASSGNAISNAAVTTAINTLSQTILGQVRDAIYPVGISIEFAEDVDPNTTIGGVWERFGNGRVTVGVDTDDTDFSTVAKTGGEKAHVLASNEMATEIKIPYGVSASGTRTVISGESVFLSGTASNYATFKNLDGTAGQAHNNLQPYITVYRWKRTA